MAVNKEERDKIIEKMEAGEEVTIGAREASTPKPLPEKTVKKKSRRSWKPANLVEIPEEFKEKGWRYYCVDSRTIRLSQKLREGYVIDKSIVPKMIAAGIIDGQPATLQDGHAKDSTLNFRELKVVKIREEDAQARDEFFKSKNPLNEKLQEQDDSFHSETGGRTYGDIKLKKGE